MLKIISKLVLKIMGYKIVGELPRHSKYIITLAPHTSNWDFVIARCFGYQLGVKAKYFGKSQLFVPPIGWLFRLFGGIPVVRTKNNNLVQFAVDLFNQSNSLVIGIAPEGTRKRVKKWKTGFYHIANQANLPIALGFIDYKNKEAGIGKIIFPTGNLLKDFEQIETFYKTKPAKYTELYNTKIY